MHLKPLLIYDSNCKVCVQQKENLEFLLGHSFEAVSFRYPNFVQTYPEIPLSECEQAIQFVNSAGKRFGGAEAVARVVALRWFFYPAMLLYYVPGLRKIWDFIYRWIAKNRF